MGGGGWGVGEEGEIPIFCYVPVEAVEAVYEDCQDPESIYSGFGKAYVFVVYG